ncbi:MAG: iron ABC transporter permease [Chloroflexi bacterium]|nr:iron ABC transporter permease [Chloroflexota bacterium]
MIARRDLHSTPPLLIILNTLLVGLLLLPAAYLVIRAADDPGDAWDYITQTRTLDVLWNSVVLALMVALGSTILGVPLAWLTVRTDLIGRRWWTVLFTLPLVLPSYVGAFALLSAVGPSGFVQDWLGVERLPDIRGFFGAWLSITLFAFPYVFLSVRAGLRGLDPQLEAASQVLGKNPLQTFLRITFPQLIPSIQAGALLTMLYALSDFGAVAFMRFNAFTRVIYIQNTQSFRPSRVAMLSLELVALAILVIIVSRWIEGNAAAYRRQNTRPPTRISLGRWQIPALLFCGMVIMLALNAPVGVIAYWLINGLQTGQELNDIFEPLQNSMRIAGITALVAGLVGLPLVFLQARFPGTISRWLNIGATLGFALPGVVVAISLVYFATRYAGSIYQTLPLLIFAYLVRFLPQLIGPLRASFLQINPHVEESALTLGKNRWQVFATITAPLIRSGWIAGVALVFLTVMKELPATLILSPTGFSTLATEIWSATGEAFYARAAAPALVLVLVSALSLIYILEPND